MNVDKEGWWMAEWPFPCFETFSVLPTPAMPLTRPTHLILLGIVENSAKIFVQNVWKNGVEIRKSAQDSAIRSGIVPSSLHIFAYLCHLPSSKASHTLGLNWGMWCCTRIHHGPTISSTCHFQWRLDVSRSYMMRIIQDNAHHPTTQLSRWSSLLFRYGQFQFPSFYLVNYIGTCVVIGLNSEFYPLFGELAELCDAQVAMAPCGSLLPAQHLHHASRWRNEENELKIMGTWSIFWFCKIEMIPTLPSLFSDWMWLVKIATWSMGSCISTLDRFTNGSTQRDRLPAWNSATSGGFSPPCLTTWLG